MERSRPFSPYLGNMVISVSGDRFFGESGTSHKAGDYLVTLSNHRAGQRTPHHYHKAPYLCLVLNGSFTERSQQYNRCFEPGFAILHSSGHHHLNRFHAPTQCLNITLPPESDSIETKLLRSKRILAMGAALALSVVQAERNLFVQESLSSALVAELTGGGKPGWLKAARTVTERHYGQSLCISKMAEVFGVHPVHYARSFRTEYGVGYEEYLDSVRLNEATRLLKETEYDVSVISYRCGFSEPSRLSRLFKARFGTTPRAYRAAI